MFKKWLSEHDLSKLSFSTRLFPKAGDHVFWGKALNEDFVKTAEEYLGYEWPLIRATQYMEFQKSGNRKAQEKPHFARRQALLTLFVGELAEHKGRFLPDICDGIFALCEESFWGLSAHIYAAKRHFLPDSVNHYIDLFAAETGELLSVIYHIMYDELKEYCPELVERMEYELDQRIIKAYLAHTGFWWMGNNGRKVNNWNPWIISNILTVFLTVRPEKSVFENGLYKMLTEISHYYESMPDDGGCDEGCNYWGVAGAKLFAFCDQLYIATDGKLNFFNDQKLHNIIHYELKAYIGGSYFVNYGDGNAKMRANHNHNLVYALYGYGLRIGSPEFLKFTAALKRADKDDGKQIISSGCSAKSTLWSLIFADGIAAEEEYTQNSSYVLPDLQHAYLHNGEWFSALKGGSNVESHNHNDVGNFMVYCDAEPVIIDAGCGTYTKFTFSPERYTIWTMRSGYHNLPVINGVEQMNGTVFKADGFEANGNTAEVSFASAYPETAGVQSVERTVRVTEHGVNISDKFELTNETNGIEEHFMTLLKPELTDDGVVLGGKYLLTTDLPASIEYKSFDGDQKLINAWGTDGVYRIIVSAECQKSASFEFQIRRTKK